ncbi:keratin, type I cytoskeletal 47 kDa-like isoform X2 [Amblyraja radiata]|uniref:keratin, type I cytoskeletal 47 kDa-like isoform X2 n=1 Tax=Amblyraja radiata TaxID=386614 RepID=UPI0014024416|nr:keratin, type I cytoskeletal 47 kDa-like isoform X2 [Amblyraja radiata]
MSYQQRSSGSRSFSSKSMGGYGGGGGGSRGSSSFSSRGSSSGMGMGAGFSRGSSSGMSLGFGSGSSSGLGFGSGSGSSSSMSFAMSSSGMGSGSGLFNNEKQTMQDLNDRLAHYLDMVRALEKSNSELEIQIRTHSEKHAAVQRDYSAYWVTISGLRDQITDMILGNSGYMLQVDNSKLAAEDFRSKYENELTIRMSVENDINGLRSMLDNMTMDKSQLEMDIENLKEELIYIRKNHEDEMKGMRTQVAGNVSVDVKTEQEFNLLAAMEEIRAKYEAAAKKNKDDLENWYKEQCVTVELQISVNAGAVDAEKSQLSELRRTLQGLETEFQTYMSMISSLEQNLNGIELRYSTERSKIEMKVNTLEMELTELRGRIMTQTDEYAVLLNIKCILETEIATYRRLLGGYGHATQITASTTSTTRVQEVVKEEVPKEPVITKRLKYIEVCEVIVDGQVVSTQSQTVKS